MMLEPNGRDPLLEQGIYLLMDGINEKSCKEAIDFILTHNMIKPRLKKLQIMINSPGGSVPAAMALIEVMKGSKIPIHTVGLGMIASCGLLIFMSGEKGHRVLTPNTSILSHQWSWGSVGKEHELFSVTKQFKLNQQMFIRHYKKCTGMDEKTIKEILLPESDVWLTPQEAKKYGIADRVSKVY